MNEKAGEVGRTINGVKVTFYRCEHCAAVPSDTEMADSVASEVRERRKCAACGETQKVFAVTLYHYKERGRDWWRSCCTQADPMLMLGGIPGVENHEAMVHVRCAKKALPYVDWSETDRQVQQQ